MQSLLNSEAEERRYQQLAEARDFVIEGAVCPLLSRPGLELIDSRAYSPL